MFGGRTGGSCDTTLVSTSEGHLEQDFLCSTRHRASARREGRWWRRRLCCLDAGGWGLALALRLPDLGRGFWLTLVSYEELQGQLLIRQRLLGGPGFVWELLLLPFSRGAGIRPRDRAQPVGQDDRTGTPHAMAVSCLSSLRNGNRTKLALRP